MEHRKGFTVGRVLPCYKRLQPLERCNECRIDGPEFLSYGGFPILGTFDDREPYVAPPITRRTWVFRRAGVVHAQGEDELIERRPQSMRDVTNDRTPLDRRRLAGRFGEDDDITPPSVFCPVVWLHVNAVSVVCEASDTSRQSVNVFVRPINLGLGVG
jgi:hypothetical protein